MNRVPDPVIRDMQCRQNLTQNSKWRSQVFDVQSTLGSESLREGGASHRDQTVRTRAPVERERMDDCRWKAGILGRMAWEPRRGRVEKVDRKRQDRIQTSDRGWDLLWWQQGAMAALEQGAGLALTTSSANPPSIALVPVANRQGSKNACVESAYLKVSIKKEKNHETVYVVWSQFGGPKYIYTQALCCQPPRSEYLYLLSTPWLGQQSPLGPSGLVLWCRYYLPLSTARQVSSTQTKEVGGRVGVWRQACLHPHQLLCWNVNHDYDTVGRLRGVSIFLYILCYSLQIVHGE